MKLAIVLALLALSCACSAPAKDAPPAPPSGEGAGTPIGDACANLRRIPCAEGFPNARTGRTCFEMLSKVAELATVPTDCLAAAKSSDEVRACGEANSAVRVRCLPALPKL